jgi:integrase
MEVLGMQRAWIHAHDHSIFFPDTKAGKQVRVIRQAALDILVGLPNRDNSLFVFPADWGDGHFIGIARVLDGICARAKPDDDTPHVLRHTFASIAAELGFLELMIASLLGHASGGVTQRYINLDKALAAAADLSAEIGRPLLPHCSAIALRAAG